MLPRSGRKPLTLDDGTIPKWLPHQREVNHLVTSIATSRGRRVLWASSWDCPFPSRAGMFTLPQPDYVLVEERDGAPHLIFGEHDRGTEPVERFIARKVELYAALASFPEACQKYFGLRSFEVHVSVIDTRTKAPFERLWLLQAAANKSATPGIFRFTLGGWLFAYATEKIWMAGPPESASVRCQDHAARHTHADADNRSIDTLHDRSSDEDIEDAETIRHVTDRAGAAIVLPRERIDAEPASDFARFDGICSDLPNSSHLAD
jgi:hypothetical protein